MGVANEDGVFLLVGAYASVDDAPAHCADTEPRISELLSGQGT